MIRIFRNIIEIMKKAEKQLYKAFREKNNDHEPLENIRKATGELRHFPGNPKFKAEISITVHTEFWQAIAPNPGVQIAPAALPANLQTQLPVYLFGLTDFFGGFLKFNGLFPVGQWNIIDIAIVNQPIIANWAGFIAAPNLQIGDLVIILNDEQPVGTLYHCFISVHCNNVAYGTFLHSFVSDIITLNMLRYSVPAANINQLINPLVFGYQTLFGKFKTDTIDPRGYITGETFQQQIADIPVHLPVDKNLMLGTFLEFDCQLLNFIMTVQKVTGFRTHRI